MALHSTIRTASLSLLTSSGGVRATRQSRLCTTASVASSIRVEEFSTRVAIAADQCLSPCSVVSRASETSGFQQLLDVVISVGHKLHEGPWQPQARGVVVCQVG